MIHAFDEIIDFIVAGTSTSTVAMYEASAETKRRVEDLIHREKTTGLSDEETAELDDFMQLEHIMRLAKARARTKLSHE